MAHFEGLIVEKSFGLEYFGRKRCGSENVNIESQAPGQPGRMGCNVPRATLVVAPQVQRSVSSSGTLNMSLNRSECLGGKKLRLLLYRQAARYRYERSRSRRVKFQCFGFWVAS